MGNHTPIDRNRTRSVADTLVEAELDHWLDCPNADVPLRAAAFLLDVIFFSLGTSGIHHLASAAISLHNALSSAMSEPVATFVPLLILYASWSLKTIVALLYFVWTVSRFAGTPAKLLLGLRVIDNTHGGHLTMAQAMLREIVGKLCFGWFLIFTLPNVTAHKSRAFQDWLANSTVKKVHG